LRLSRLFEKGGENGKLKKLGGKVWRNLPFARSPFSPFDKNLQTPQSNNAMMLLFF
jgi:hypothetical protein